MELVTIDTLRMHCRADGDDDELIERYGNAAEAACAKRISRALFPDDVTFAAALETVPTLLSAAWDTYETEMEAAEAITNENAKAAAKIAAAKKRDIAIRKAAAISNGMVATDDIIVAILLLVKTWYDTGTTVVTGQGAAAVELPFGAETILARHDYQGD